MTETWHDPSRSPARPTPRDLGFRMPPEWEPHAATWISWPFDDALWEGYLEGVRRDVAGLVVAVARFEPVVLNVRDDEAETDARARLAEAGVNATRLAFHRVPLNDAWFRDNGPIFVRDAGGRVALTDWSFNAWGGKYAPWDDDDRAPAAVARHLGMRRFEAPAVLEGGSLEVSGDGVCLTTRSCLLSPRRNPGMDERAVEALLVDYLGVSRVTWLDEGLEGDHTDGHIDTLARFAGDDALVCAVASDEDDPNHATLSRNLEALRALRRPDGSAHRVLELPLPLRRLELHGKRLAASYVNFYVGNGFVVVPQYDDAHDGLALEVVGGAFPDREVIGLGAAELVTGGGAFHCVTQQQPLGEVDRG